MCMQIGFFDTESILDQDIPKQQIYFELPFYMFVTVITAFLFVWQHFYEIVLASLDEDEVSEEEQDSFEKKGIRGSNTEPLLESDEKMMKKEEV